MSATKSRNRAKSLTDTHNSKIVSGQVVRLPYMTLEQKQRKLRLKSIEKMN
jgi:hypothetical protein